MSDFSIDLSDRTALAPLGRLLSAVERVAADIPVVRIRLPGAVTAAVTSLAAFRFDLERAGAWLLGKDARRVLAHGPDQPRLLESLDGILRPEIDLDGALGLVSQMPPGDRDRQLAPLSAFYAGLFERRAQQS